MAIYDLTHLMTPDMPVYPGKGQPEIRPAATIEKDGYREMSLRIDGHTGTHMDAPAHMLANGHVLNDFPVSRFMGKALVIRVPEGVTSLDEAFLNPYKEKIGQAEFILFNTGWSKYWGKKEYLHEFPVLTVEAARWLVSLKIKGIGLDTISVDPVESESWPVHHILFQNDLVIVENLVIPDFPDATIGDFMALPLRFVQSDGSPVRAVLITG